MSVVYGCTALVGTTKKGVLRCDPDGYYDVVLGAFNFHNSGGAFYPLEPAKAVIEGSSPFTRRLKAGSLYAENGHPKYQVGMTDRQFLARLSRIEETNQCAHIKEVWLGDEVPDPQGGKGILCMGRVKPVGVFGEAMAAMFENPNENVCFSIRSITVDRMCPSTGRRIKSIKHIETFDRVTEPGISVATKWNAPGLESFGLESMDSIDLNRNQVESVINEMEMAGIGHESSQLNSLKSIRDSIDWSSTASGLVVPRRSVGRGNWT